MSDDPSTRTVTNANGEQVLADHTRDRLVELIGEWNTICFRKMMSATDPNDYRYWSDLVIELNDDTETDE